VKLPFIYVEEKIDRVVGRRTKSPDALSVENSRKADAIAWRKAFGGVRVPGGVHRFHTQDEADDWLWRMVVRPTSELETRNPTVEDLRDLCRELNWRQACYLVVGSFAMRAAGYSRATMVVGLLVAEDGDNESRVFSALSTLPDNAVRELQPGELQQYNVIRVADEILVDLMRSAGGIEYAEAAKDVIVREIQGVPIPFASPRLLWRMKVVTHREKDAADLVFLRYWFAERGEEPPRAS
jgi:hypothetical protein